MWDFTFFFNSIMLGIGLAMDAFSVSLANGLHEPNMKTKKVSIISLTFAVFQAIMPLIGWICVHTILQYFQTFEKFIPWIALFLLAFIGGKMLYDGIKNETSDESSTKLGIVGLLIQGVATSIDALSVGFTIAEHNFIHAFVSVLIIGLITFIICFIGVIIGKKFGNKISNRASIFGGIILILIGLEIFILNFI